MERKCLIILEYLAKSTKSKVRKIILITFSVFILICIFFKIIFWVETGSFHRTIMKSDSVHGIVHEGHGKQNHAHHDQVHGVKHRVGDGGLIQNLAEFLARHQVQGDGAGQARVPDDEAGVGGGDQQGIVHGGDPAHHFLGQQGAGDQAEAPVQPAADGGDEGGGDEQARRGERHAGDTRG